MLAQLIQRQIPIGGKATFSLQNGQEISGILAELGRDHLSLECAGGITVIPLDRIVCWHLADKQTVSVRGSGGFGSAGNAVPHSDVLPVYELSTVESQESTEPQVLRKVLEIEARFQAKSDVAAPEVKEPDFAFPADELKGARAAEAQTVWNRVREKYSYAQKINELSPKFGRIQPIVRELKTLSEIFPNSSAVRRCLGYFHWLLRNYREAMDLYKDAALISDNAWDWHNLAALALEHNQDDLACYALAQFFAKTSVADAQETWYRYVGLLKKNSNYLPLKELANTEGRPWSEAESEILFETGIYVLGVMGKGQSASLLTRKWLEGQSAASLISGIYGSVEGQTSETYQKLVSELEGAKRPRYRKNLQQPQGYVYNYRADRGFGFLRGEDGESYFFHRSAVSDDELLEKVRNWAPGMKIPVAFQWAKGTKGPIAVEVTLQRSVPQIFERAVAYANDGEYSQAIAQVRKVLEIDPEHPQARECLEKWREYARVVGVPKGSSPYARAKRAQIIEKDLDKAAQLLHSAISQGDNVESAVKDLATLLVQQGKPEAAIEVLKKSRAKLKNQQSVDNLLINVYQNAGEYDQALTLLESKLGQAFTESKKAQILWQIAYCCLKKEDYEQAESRFRAVLKLQPDNRVAQRNLAVCYFKQGRYDEAERLLNEILDTSPDDKAAELLEAIGQARAGQVPGIDDILIEVIFPDYYTEISKFTQFWLERCDFQGVPPDRVRNGRFRLGDIQKLEDLASKLGTRRPRDRAGYYLSAAKIVAQLEDGDPNLFHKFLCRSFASRGDAVVVESGPLDSAREFYCEALKAYDGDRSKRDEQDAVNALVRFVFSTLGHGQIPVQPQIPPIDEAIETVVSRHPDRNKAFDMIAYLVSCSHYAAKRVLDRVYGKTSLRVMALEYLMSRGVPVTRQVNRPNDFVRLWNELRRRNIDEARAISNELRGLAGVELNTAWLEASSERVKRLVDRLFLELDQQRMEHLQKILEAALELCKQVAFEEQEWLCIQIDNRCQDLSKEIENSPTSISVEHLYPLVESVRMKVNAYLSRLYESSVPQLTLRLPVESYVPDGNQQIEVQLAISNRIGCSPAEALELIVQEYDGAFTLGTPLIKLEGSLRGGDQRILRVPLRLGAETLASQTFSLPVYAQYRTRAGEVTQTPVNIFSIRLYSEEDFEEIENPYAAYAEGGIVGDPQMFYGREEMIHSVAKAIQESRTQSKCVVIFGQKRAGKSSILHHLKAQLQTDASLLVLDIGNIGAILDEHSSYPFLYQLLWSILKRLEFAIEDKVSGGLEPLALSIPTDKEFYEHPSPLALFGNVLERFRRAANRSTDWRGVRLVLLIDEFSYIYGCICAQRIPETFMKNWKALLQENHFSAVLVGQDVMPKFKQQFPNEFGTTQDERVTYLRLEDAIRLVDEPIRIHGRQGESRYREKAIDRILDLTADSPFYIQIFCARLVEYMNRKRARLVTEADVEQVKEELISGANALGLDKFDNLLNSGDTSEHDAISDEDALKVLTAIAVNSQTGPCGRHAIVCETHVPIDRILDDLVRRDVIERERSQYYSIRVGLFKEWLLAHQ